MAKTTKKLTDNQMLTAILSYLWILWIIPLLVVKKRDEFIKFHLSQGINLFIVQIIVGIVLYIIAVIPIISIISTVLSWIAWLFFLIVIIVAIIKGVQGEKWSIPLVERVKLVKL